MPAGRGARRVFPGSRSLDAGKRRRGRRRRRRREKARGRRSAAGRRRRQRGGNAPSAAPRSDARGWPGAAAQLPARNSARSRQGPAASRGALGRSCPPGRPRARPGTRPAPAGTLCAPRRRPGTAGPCPRPRGAEPTERLSLAPLPLKMAVEGDL